MISLWFWQKLNWSWKNCDSEVMKVKNPIYELKNKRAYILEDAEKALKARDMETYNAKMDEVKKINAEIEAHEALQAEQGRFNDDDKKFVDLAIKQAHEKEEEALRNKVDAIRSTREYTRAFFDALAMGATVKSGRNIESLKPLYNALTETGGTPAGSEGGFLVPIDFDNAIREVMRQYVNLADYVSVENVTTLSGWRAVEVGPAQQGFAEINELTNIPDAEQPSFKKVEYTVRKFGGKIPISNELLSDNQANLMGYLARWFGRKAVLTNNTQILAVWDTLTATAYDTAGGIQGLKKALNLDLDPDISRNAIIVTNQSGWDFLDQLEDGQGRPLLQPDPTNSTQFSILGRPVVMMSNSLLPNRNDGTNDHAPLYIGSGTQFTTLFRRLAVEVASTNVGAGAFETDSTVVRGLMRLDVQKVDDAAMVKYEIQLA